MSTAVLPTLPGVAYPVGRSMVDNVTIQSNISGKEVRVNNQTYPRYRWSLSYNLLRSAAALAEYQQLLGFINLRYGRWDTFLYLDADDNTVTGQTVATGDGTTTAFQLIRTFGGFIEPMLAPNTGATINVYLNGVKQLTGYAVSGWGTSTPGVLTFTAAPTSGVAITADFSYYWPCRFDMDSYDFSLFMNSFYEMKSLKLISVKN